MGDSGVAAVDGDFSELEDDGGGWGEDVLAEDSHREDGPVAFFEVEEFGDAGRIEACDRDSVRHGDFVGLGVRTTSLPAQTTTGVIRKPERVG